MYNPRQSVWQKQDQSLLPRSGPFSREQFLQLSACHPSPSTHHPGAVWSGQQSWPASWEIWGQVLPVQGLLRILTSFPYMETSALHLWSWSRRVRQREYNGLPDFSVSSVTLNPSAKTFAGWCVAVTAPRWISFNLLSHINWRSTSPKPLSSICLDFLKCFSDFHAWGIKL